MQKAQAKVSYRIPLVGGITDYPDFYRGRGTQSICCLIDKYLMVSITKNGHGGIKIESKADLPWGMGLGSSGAFHSALVLAFAKAKGMELSKLAIAKLAYELETGIEPNATGRQDSIACLFRGMSKINYFPDDSVAVDRIKVPSDWRKKISSRLMLFDTGVRRRAGDSIKDILQSKNKPLLNEIAKLPDVLLRAWESGDLDFLGMALERQEYLRSRLSPTCRSGQTDMYLKIAKRCGAGARLTGAGLGCLLCYCAEEKQHELRERLHIPQIQFSILW